MTDLRQIASTLRWQLKRKGMTQESLRQQAGVARQTLTNVLSGEEDYKVTTLLTLADRLGLDVVLVPKAVAPALAAQDSPPRIKSAVEAALERLQQRIKKGR